MRDSAIGWRRLAIAGAVLLATFFSALGRETSSVDAPTLGVGNPETFNTAYERWRGHYSASGGGESLRLGLGYHKGLSSAFTRARGGLSLDFATGALEAELTGLEGPDALDLWFVDNAPGHSVRPEPGDAMSRVGAFRVDDGRARLATTLAPDRIRGLRVDLAVVTRAGETPLDGGLLFGSPSLFQRMYHGDRTSSIASNLSGAAPRARDESAVASVFELLVPPPAHANGHLTLEQLIALGEELFFEETFGGNGRTCGTCHPADNNFTIDPPFIARLPADDPLFVHEQDPVNLGALDNAVLLRELAVVLENVDGFENPGVMRGVPHILALGTSIAPAPDGVDGSSLPGVPPLDRLGWSGDGSANDGSLRDFPTGAVTQHFPKTLARVDGVDFVLPTPEELDAMAAFQLSVGRAEDPDLTAMEMSSPVAERGRILFLSEDSEGGGVPAAKCNSCHFMGGATVSDSFVAANSLAPGRYNFNLDIGVQEMADPLASVVDPLGNPPDAGWGQDPNVDLGGFGNGTFNTPPLIEAADTPPFFHNNTVFTLEAATIFYQSGAFNASPGANDFLTAIDDPPGFGHLVVDDTHLVAVAAFVRVLNALENIRSAIAYIDRIPSLKKGPKRTRQRVVAAAAAELEDAAQVLDDIGIHTDAVDLLLEARHRVLKANGRKNRLARAVDLAEQARDLMVN